MINCTLHYSTGHEIDHWQIDAIAIEGKPGSKAVITHFESVI